MMLEISSKAKANSMYFTFGQLNWLMVCLSFSLTHNHHHVAHNVTKCQCSYSLYHADDNSALADKKAVRMIVNAFYDNVDYYVVVGGVGMCI
jgi:hypothetical protein